MVLLRFVKENNMSISRYLLLLLVGYNSLTFGSCADGTQTTKTATVSFTIASSNNLAISSSNVSLTSEGGGSFDLTSISGNDPSGTCVTVTSAKGALLLQDESGDVSGASSNASEHIQVDYSFTSIDAEDASGSTALGIKSFQPSTTTVSNEMGLYEAPAGKVFDNQNATCTIKLHDGENLSAKVAGTYSDTITLALEAGACD